MALVAEIKSNNLKDLQQRYGGTYGFLPRPNGSRLAVKIHEIGNSYTLVSDKNGINYRINNDTGGVLEFTQVNRGWYEIHPGKLVLLMRIPEKQWKRGISHENTRVLTFNKVGELVDDDWDGDTIQQLFYKDPDAEYEATGINCMRLSKFFAIGEKSIYITNRLIGQLEGNVATITDPLFRQELEDAFNRNNMKVTVTNAESHD